MTGAARIPFVNKTYKVSQAYSGLNLVNYPRLIGFVYLFILCMSPCILCSVMTWLLLICSAFESQLSVIQTLAWSKYKKWRRDVELALGLKDLDMCLVGC